jgi:hypothetical protein
MNLTRKPAILASFALILVSVAIQPKNLQADAMLVLTENSSTSLRATLDGAALLVFPGADSWLVNMPTGDLFPSPNPSLFRHEPESTSKANLVTWGDIQIVVTSESFFPLGRLTIMEHRSQ